MGFRITALPETLFSDLFALTDSELAERSCRRMVVDAKPGFPCRVSLADAEIGETVILVNYEHQPNNTPYRASHAIFVRQGVKQAKLSDGEIPELLRIRPLSVRAFDKTHMLVSADVVDGEVLHTTIEDMFSNPEVTYLHVHNAKPGCYNATVHRS